MLKNYLKEKKHIIEKNLEKTLNKYEYPSQLSEAMKYGVMNGGKRIRPAIMYIICDLFKRDYEIIQDISVALEFIHCYSLIHDDLPAMDDDTYRRGNLTVHKKYDEATAILAGDALLTEAFNTICHSTKINSDIKIEIIKKLSEYAGFYGMIGGQYVDMESENKNVPIETLNYIHNYKTGKLLIASFELPLIALGIDKKQKTFLIEYAKNMGLIFQIKDDILDIEGDFKETGKEATDEKNQKTTYPKLYGLEKSKEILKKYMDISKDIINNNFKNNERKDLLIELVDFLGNRGA